MTKYIYLIIFVCFLQNISAQEKWDIAKCITYAQNTNLQVKQSEYAVQQNAINYAQSKDNWLPNATGSLSYGYNYGFSINPTNNQVISSGVATGSYGLNGGMLLYGGGQIKNNIAQNELNLNGSREDWEQVKNNIALSVAQAYLQILLAMEILENAKLQITSTEEQLKRTEKLIQAGTVAEAIRYPLDAQIATEQLAIVNAENQIQSAMLSLKQLMNLPFETPLEIVAPDLSNVEPSLSLLLPSEIYKMAVPLQHNLKSAELRIRSSEIGIALAKGAKLPTLTAFAQANTRLSSAAKRATGEIAGYNQTPISFSSNLGQIDGTLSQAIPKFETTPIVTQLSRNLGAGVGVSLNVPIYNRGQNNTNVQLAELAVKNAQVNAEIQKQTLYQNIQRAHLDVQNAYNSYIATQKQITSLEIAWENAQKQFNFGTSTFLDFTLAKNNLNRSKNDLTRMKYDLIFKMKILDFYQGKAIKL
jgi:outer membrane protein